MVRVRPLVRLVAALLLAVGLTGCASREGSGPAVTRTAIDYDSTRDGPRPPPTADDPAPGGEDGAKGAAGEQKAECAHVWEALPRAMHTYPDPAAPFGPPALCTPVVCTKCGLVRHECQRRRRR